MKKHIPDFFWPYEDVIIERIGRSSVERYVKPQSKRRARKLNKELFASQEFEDFWLAIAQRTTYKVSVNSERLIEESVQAIKAAPPIAPLRIEVTRAGVKILRGGTKTTETGKRSAELQGTYDLPDIVTELQEATSLTRNTIVEVLVQSGRLAEFIANPNDYIQMVKGRMQTVLAEIVTNGVQYERIGGYVYEFRELQEDGQQEKDRFLDQMYKLENPEKSAFDYVIFDSDPERKFAELLDGRDDIKLFMKLPSKFKIDTPVGPYNPDWAIIQHFEAIGVGDFAVSTPANWRLRRSGALLWADSRAPYGTLLRQSCATQHQTHEQAKRTLFADDSARATAATRRSPRSQFC